MIHRIFVVGLDKRNKSQIWIQAENNQRIKIEIP